MMPSTRIKPGLLTVLAAAGLVFAWFALRPNDMENEQFAEKANLALRRTAHHLLLESGDSTSRIAPVQTLGKGVFLVRLERPFNYDHLPALLQESFKVQGIQAKYDVAVLDCASGDLQLGYNVNDLLDPGGVPCGGREQGNGCYNLQVTFTEPGITAGRTIGWILAVGFLAGAFFYGLWRSPKKNSPDISLDPSNESRSLNFGGSSLDLTNQLLRTGSVRHPLTYRETKLLQLFVSHCNQLLERDFILQAVWEEEGIIVGRSVDVFVSRLRKMLRDDPTVRIVTQHGVGYRLETVVPANPDSVIEHSH